MEAAELSGCPCGSQRCLDACCGPLVEDGVPAATAEQLMRSRYTAFVLGRRDHLWRTWHPRTRPDQVEVGDVHWTGLSILDVVAGGAADQTGTVEFEAHYVGPDGLAVMRERSVFERRGGRWTYIEGTEPVGGPEQS
ncbi:YchJ family protein [Dietzia psychralcaliphila]|uniref:YchJ family protein n=1 Tax=Dietzia psychralcaliphila TaxID=139021 RepID=UPI001C1E29CA|nr:YchJ family metal-binding protein [Dietzia psychralcaliphila]